MREIIQIVSFNNEAEMTGKKVKIEYEISSPEETNNFHAIRWINGGVRICVDGKIITKAWDIPMDRGFRYDSVYYTILSFLAMIPLDLQKNKSALCRFIDNECGFSFTPEGDQTRIKYRDFGEPRGVNLTPEGVVVPRAKLIDDYNRHFADYPDGTLVPTRDLIDAIIQVGEKFVAYLEENVPQPNKEFEEIRTALENAKESARKI